MTFGSPLLRWSLLIGLFASLNAAHAESSAAKVSSGFSMGSDAVKVINPQGSGVGINFDGRFVSSEISLTGNGQPVPPRILPAPAPVDLSRAAGFTNPDVFFKNIGKTNQEPSYRRPSTLR